MMVATKGSRCVKTKMLHNTLYDIYYQPPIPSHKPKKDNTNDDSHTHHTTTSRPGTDREIESKLEPYGVIAGASNTSFLSKQKTMKIQLKGQSWKTVKERLEELHNQQNVVYEMESS